MTTILATLLNADSLYYSTGKSPLSDAEYDALREQFRKQDPNHPYFSTVGAKIPVDSKAVQHRIVAGSQEKVKNPQEVHQWGQRGGKKGYKMQWKLDGYTLVLQYDLGILNEAASRGDGEIGESVLWNAVLMSSIPKRLPVPFTGDVRGEVVLSKVLFQKYFTPLGYSNPRNAVAVIRDQKGTGLAQYLDFIAFDFNELGEDQGFTTEQERTDFMTALGFTTVEGELVPSVKELIPTFTQFESRREQYDYEVDGVVVRYEDLGEQQAVGSTSDLRPRGQRCIKFANDEAETTCIGYELTIGSTGAIIPTLKFNPVELGGARVSSVLGCNFSLLKERGIHVGDKVVLSRRGGVIPYVESVVSPGVNRQPILPPEYCPCCGSKTHQVGAYLRCTNEECEGRGFRLLLLWAQKREIKGLGETLLQALYDEYNIRYPADLYRLDYATLSGVQMSGRCLGSGATQVLEELEKSKQCPIEELVGSLGVKHLGRREAENIMERTGIRTLEGWFQLTAEQLLAVEGYKDIKAQGIVQGLIKARPLIDALLEVGVKWYYPDTVSVLKVVSKTLHGEVLVFTGAIQKLDTKGDRYTRKRMQDLAVANGASIEEDIKKGVTMLVTADVNAPKPSSKMVKANKLGIRITSEEEFFTLLGL